MPAFQRPFDPSTATAVTEIVSLPDPRANDGSVSRFARLPNVAIPFPIATPTAPGGMISFRWPATGSVRRVDLTAADQASLGISELVELSPLPFAIAPVLRALVPGVPTFYIGLAGATLPEHDHVVLADDPAILVDRVVIGCVFQDRVSLQPSAWIEIIGRGLDAGAPSEVAEWRTLANLFDAQTGLHVRDAAGRPASGETFRLRFLDASDNELRVESLTTDAAGTLGAAALPQPGEHVELAWQGTPLLNDQLLPIMALYEDGLADQAAPDTVALPGGGPLILPEGFAGGHLQITDLARWLAAAVPSPNNAWPERFHPGCKFEPLVDGLATYRALVADMRSASGIHICGWTFHDFPMRPYEQDSTLSELLETIGRDKFRILVARFFLPQIDAVEDLTADALLAVVAVMVASEPLIVLKDDLDKRGFLAWTALIVLIVAVELALNPERSVADFLREKVEFTSKEVRELLYDVSDNKPPCAFSAPHPAIFADNPLAQEISLLGLGKISNLQEGFGVYHHKFQIVEKENDPDEPYVGYVGGIDINTNRLDSPGHNAARYRAPDDTSPPMPGTYHDVHARITGPATQDLAGIFHERLIHALDFEPANVEPDPLYTKPQNPVDPVFQPPIAAQVPHTGRHLVRISQTAFKPGPGREGEAFPWATDGDISIRQNFEKAIRSACEYIYIEEQYFTLDDGLIQALRDAADHCQRLVIVVAANTRDQLFGDERRMATLERLAGATGGPGGWGGRMIAGSPFRRPVLPHAEFRASVGRANLIEDIPSSTTGTIFVGPETRVPGGLPYFFWIDGELMFAFKSRTVTSPSGKPAKELEILRGSLSGSSPPFCPHPRPHKSGAPVTFANIKDIFVHAKLLMVDDIFVAVGSSNWNRRGFFHDGEIDGFAIPEHLRAAIDNPAKRLRTELWAEHLGLPPLMGQSLLADPIAAFELFQRSQYEGNRFQPHRAFQSNHGDLEALNSFELFEILPTSVKTTLLGTINAVTATQLRGIWNTLIDPTSFADPNPKEGPELS